MSFRPLVAGLFLPLPAAAAVAAPPEVPVPPADGPAEMAPAPSAPKEVRGVWVVRTELGSPQAVSRVVRVAGANGLNTLFVQCRGRGDAYYCSTLEPRAQLLEGSSPQFDPLAQMVQEG